MSLLKGALVRRIGTEHEKLGYYKSSKRRIDYETIRQLLEGLCQRHGWSPIMEGEYIIGSEMDGQSVTIEPGGQFELSGAPVVSLHETYAELGSHLEQVDTTSFTGPALCSLKGQVLALLSYESVHTRLCKTLDMRRSGPLPRSLVSDFSPLDSTPSGLWPMFQSCPRTGTG